MIKRKEEYRRTVIDLDGADGNVFVLLSLAKSFCDKLDWDYSKFDAEVKFFANGYEDVVALFDSWFAEYCDLETSQEYLLKVFENQ